MKNDMVLLDCILRGAYTFIGIEWNNSEYRDKVRRIIAHPRVAKAELGSWNRAANWYQPRKF